MVRLDGGTHVPLYNEEGEMIGEIYYNGMSISIAPMPGLGAHVSNRLSPTLKPNPTRIDKHNCYIVGSFYDES